MLTSNMLLQIYVAYVNYNLHLRNNVMSAAPLQGIQLSLRMHQIELESHGPLSALQL